MGYPPIPGGARRSLCSHGGGWLASPPLTEGWALLVRPAAVARVTPMSRCRRGRQARWLWKRPALIHTPRVSVRSWRAQSFLTQARSLSARADELLFEPWLGASGGRRSERE